jgi:aryl-alcohol dehydrogenase-like predicted oxidoreductase
MTPFSVYQGRWHAAFRDIEAEIIPMCEDQGMAIVPWAALGGGQLMTSEQRKQKAQESGARPARGVGENDVKVCEALEQIAKSKKTTLQAVVCQ